MEQYSNSVQHVKKRTYPDEIFQVKEQVILFKGGEYDL